MIYLATIGGVFLAGYLFDVAMRAADSLQRARYVIQQTEREYADAD